MLNKKYRILNKKLIVVVVITVVVVASAAVLSMFMRLREQVKNHDFKFNGTKLSISFSAGIAVSDELGTPANAAKLIDASDKRLYLAKQRGRDRVVYG